MGATKDFNRCTGPEDSDCSHDLGVARALEGHVWSGVVARKGRLMLGVSVPVEDGASHVVLMTFSAYSGIDAHLAAELRHSLGSDVAFVCRGQVAAASLPLPPAIPTPTETPALVTLAGKRLFCRVCAPAWQAPAARHRLCYSPRLRRGPASVPPLSAHPGPRTVRRPCRRARMWRAPGARPDAPARRHHAARLRPEPGRVAGIASMCGGATRSACCKPSSTT